MATATELRQIGRRAVRASVPPATWAQNEAFVLELIRSIESHPVVHHPFVRALERGELDGEAIKIVLLDFHHAFGQIFAGAVLRAMQLAQEVEARLGTSAMCACRFLLQINLLTELGYELPRERSLEGDPQHAHAQRLRKLLSAVGVTDRELAEHRPSAAASALRQGWEAAYEDGPRLASLLAASEMLTQRFFSPVRNNLAKEGLEDESMAYLDMHLENVGGLLLDQAHAEDLWYVVMQLTEPSRQQEIRERTLEMVGRIAEMLDTFVALAKQEEDQAARG